MIYISSPSILVKGTVHLKINDIFPITCNAYYVMEQFQLFIVYLTTCIGKVKRKKNNKVSL